VIYCLMFSDRKNIIYEQTLNGVVDQGKKKPNDITD